MHDALDLRDLLEAEATQRRESGYDLTRLNARIEQALRNGTEPERDELLDLLESIPIQDDWPYQEPSDLDEIQALLPAPPSIPHASLDDVTLRDRLLAAWLGRCAGCMLGKPVEGWDRERIRSYLEPIGAYPLDDYIPAVDSPAHGRRMHPSWAESTRGSIRFVSRDDDIDYTLLGLHILETHGFDFTSEDIAHQWLEHLPYLRTYTAERVAYRNLIHGRQPPQTATYRNPYREWIGAQIRADMWGYVSPGDPERAVALAYKDAVVSHTGNGIYGELWASALIAAAFVTTDMGGALEISLAYIPHQCRLSEAVREVMQFRAEGIEWESARDRIEERYGHYGFVHTINNAAVVTAGLLWGDGDYSQTIGLAVQGGWDTDCNGATAGSVFGAMHGTAALPGRWVDPLNNRVRSAVMEFDNSSITDLAKRTYHLAVSK